MIDRSNNLLNISLLCHTAEISRSGYYRWQNNIDTRNKNEEQDKRDFELILEAYKFRGYDKGSRGIHMRLLNQGIRMNRKKIQRLMGKYKLICPIRKANPYRRMAKAMKTNNVSKNLVNREFQEHGPGMILLTDITYLFYNHGYKAYLSVIKDAYTKQVMAYVVSDSLAVDFVLETVNILIQNHGISLSEETILHSDQGCHYTSISFRQLLKDKKLRQSMSRRGNCWDNAPQESFFGHMKDEIHLERCSSILDLKLVIDDYMDYYNNDRYQWGLAKLSPNQYATYLKTDEYPINI
ncbi:IS3 family transposase [Clostridium estertheticum]|uniref:IS3 family transposase n=1 Tax=Clostridium estertheticum TaxID=238834 RepID=UPI001CF33FDA|nr:IS3 family transposase [Clostridium estertheticum]MCB2309479.1 IS3 family transposase [Clostridium estertheticum]MCB2347940.1 IS3 family transposase [Clostridium estertheticum]MCB2352433.1 IS3 family transposase [Clostridium estertheticum]WAG44643.1 IS3 family transposase [Clostridium estertheticum]WAG44899.1 IS3 family transposase [Clostridium estertheticum]